MIPLLVALLAALLAAAPVAMIWDVPTALAIASAVAILLWPLMALFYRAIVWLVDAISTALTSCHLCRARIDALRQWADGIE